MSQTINNATIRLYSCGGAGINVGKEYLREGPTSVGYAKVIPAFLDSSQSNLLDVRTLTENVYLLEGKDGSGGLRGENVDPIRAEIKKVLLAIPPLDFNIILSSASGGTGAVFAAAIVAELIERKAPFIVLMIGSEESVLALKNTVKSLRTLEGISRAKKTPVNMAYFFNNRATGFNAADDAVKEMTNALSILVSKQNDGLDSKDIYHFLNYNIPVESLTPALGLVELFTSAKDIEAIVNPLSLVSVYSERDAQQPDALVGYSCYGYAPISFGAVDRMHFVISTQPISDIYESIDRKLKEADEKVRSSSTAHRGIIADTATVDSDGWDV